MRLIDADKFMEYLGFDNTDEEREENVGQIVTLEDFDRQEIAHDVDRVIKKLETYISQQQENEMLSDNEKWLVKRVIEECIKIVKSGGVANDQISYRKTEVLEWLIAKGAEVTAQTITHIAEIAISNQGNRLERQQREDTNAENVEQRYMEDTIIAWIAQRKKVLSKMIIKEVVKWHSAMKVSAFPAVSHADMRLADITRSEFCSVTTAVMKLTSCIGLMTENTANNACWRDWRLWNE